MPLLRPLAGVALLGLVTGCALKGDVRRVELQVEALRADRVRADSSRAAQLDSVRAVIEQVQRELAAQQSYLVQLRGDVRTDLVAAQQQLVQIQELLGQSQQRLTELRARLEERAQQAVPPVETPGQPGVPVGPSGNVAGPGPDQMYGASLTQYNRGAILTARQGFQDFLRVYPTNEHAPDALFYIGETLAPENADSAVAVYQAVVKNYPNSPRAPTALYKLGLLAEQRNEKQAARSYFNRVVQGYPGSPEANLARDRLRRLGR